MIAGYITARSTYLARVVVHDEKPKISRYEKYLNSEFSGFDSVLSLFMRKTEGVNKIICLGVAGPVINNAVTATNLPWKIDGNQIKEGYSFNKVSIVNDIEATALGLFNLTEDKFYKVNQGTKITNGNIGLIAAGHGLGEGLLFHDGKKYHPYASEGGHSAFSPCNQIEIELWEYLYSTLGFVEAEDIISRSGLVRIYEFLVYSYNTTKGEWFKKAKDKPVAIIEKALAGDDDIAVKALDLFIDCFATETANLALKGMTLGGIYLCGELAPNLIMMIDNGQFMNRFVQKGKMESYLSKIPVNVIIENKTALLGAGCLAAELSKL